MYFRSKLTILISLLLPLFVLVRLTCTPFNVRLSYLSPFQKNFCDAYEFLNEKSGSEKRENN